MIRQAIDTTDPDAGGGRSFYYEWELEDRRLSERIDQVASGGSIASFTHTQTVPALTWTITHNLGFIPSVILIVGGREAFAEVQHPSLNQTVISHGKPFAGTAYLRL